MIARLTIAGAALGLLAGFAPALVAAPASSPTAGMAQCETTPVLPVTVRDAEGNRVTIRDTRRIVALNGDIAENIFTLGQGSRVVGTDISATYPDAAVKLQRIGYQRTLNAEGIISLRPTLVIGNTDAGPPNVLKQLRDAGVPLLILPEDDRLSGVTAKIRNTARALGVPKCGARLAAVARWRIDKALESLKGVTSRPKVAFLYVRGPRVQLLGGRGSRGDTIIQAAGGRDVGTEAGIVGTRRLTAEALVAAQPDVILIPTGGLESVGGVAGLTRLPGVAQTPAGRAQRILAFDDQYLIGLGPRTGLALREVIAGLHPGVAAR
jgi:iron complex transport system substrate-binding protein